MLYFSWIYVTLQTVSLRDSKLEWCWNGKCSKPHQHKRHVILHTHKLSFLQNKKVRQYVRSNVSNFTTLVPLKLILLLLSAGVALLHLSCCFSTEFCWSVLRTEISVENASFQSKFQPTVSVQLETWSKVTIHPKLCHPFNRIFSQN